MGNTPFRFDLRRRRFKPELVLLNNIFLSLELDRRCLELNVGFARSAPFPVIMHSTVATMA